MEPTKQTTPRGSFRTILTQINWRAWLPSRGNVVFTLVVLFALFWTQSVHALPWTQPNKSVTYESKSADRSICQPA